MGCGSPIKQVYKEEPNMVKWHPQFKALGIQDPELIQIHELYSIVKGAHPLGRLEVAHVLKVLEVERLKFMIKAFAAFRRDGSEELVSDFRDFFFSLWNFCTMNASDIAKFAFDLYDLKRNGRVNVDILIGMLKDLYGYEYRNNDIAKNATQNFINLKKPKIDRPLFLATIEKTPRLFHVALRIQSNMRRKAIDYEFWQKQMATSTEGNAVSLTRRTARVADTESNPGGDTSTPMIDAPKRSLTDQDLFNNPNVRVFKRPIGESRVAQHKAHHKSRLNAVQRAMALDQIRKNTLPVRASKKQQQQQQLLLQQQQLQQQQAAAANGIQTAPQSQAAHTAQNSLQSSLRAVLGRQKSKPDVKKEDFASISLDGTAEVSQPAALHDIKNSSVRMAGNSMRTANNSYRASGNSGRNFNHMKESAPIILPDVDNSNTLANAISLQFSTSKFPATDKKGSYYSRRRSGHGQQLEQCKEEDSEESQNQSHSGSTSLSRKDQFELLVDIQDQLRPHKITKKKSIEDFKEGDREGSSSGRSGKGVGRAQTVDEEKTERQVTLSK